MSVFVNSAHKIVRNPSIQNPVVLICENIDVVSFLIHVYWYEPENKNSLQERFCSCLVIARKSPFCSVIDEAFCACKAERRSLHSARDDGNKGLNFPNVWGLPRSPRLTRNDMEKSLRVKRNNLQPFCSILIKPPNDPPTSLEPLF